MLETKRKNKMKINNKIIIPKAVFNWDICLVNLFVMDILQKIKIKYLILKVNNIHLKF